MNAPAGRVFFRTTAVRRSPTAVLLTAVRQYDPLLRNGHLLTVSSLLTAGVGAAYWALAAHLFGPGSVGRGYAAVSAMMFLGGIGQLNLVNTMIRFVAPAGARTGRLVAGAYLAAVTCALLLGAGFVLLIPRLASGLSFLHTPLVGAGFAAATAGYALFVLQDGVLTGLRRADWVVAENALFATVKVLLLALFAAAGPLSAILGSWGVGLVVSLVFTNTFLFVQAIPRHLRRAPAERSAPAVPTVRYLAADWTASMCWLAATTLPPIIVLDRLGAARSAYFSIAWLVAYALYQFAINMCASLIVEATGSPGELRRHCLHVLRHSGSLLALGTLLVAVAAPWLLAVFGPAYASGGVVALRLLALSALPNLVVCVAVAVCRVRRRMRVVVASLAVQAILVLGLTVVLLRPMGVAGAGIAWLVAQCVVAGGLLWRRSWWLPEPAAEGSARESATSPVAVRRTGPGWMPLRGLLPIRRPGLIYRPAARLTARRLALRIDPVDAPSLHRSPQGRSDVLVFRLEDAGAPALAVKHPRNSRASATLAREWDVLRQLEADPRLGEWRRLLPLPVSRQLDEQLPMVTQCWLPGVSAEDYLRKFPRHTRQVAAASLTAVHGLHRATGRAERVNGRIDEWVGPRRAVLSDQIEWCRAGPGAAGLDALSDRVHEELAGRPMTIAWIHGDFAPGNVLLAENGNRVTGLLDWGGAGADAPAGIDAHTFVLALRCRLANRSWGSLVTEVLRAGSLPSEDRALLDAAGVDDALGRTALPLLAWLWHVSSNLDKSPRYGRSRWWVVANVVPVLSEVARWPER
ncbi:O-antigen/teichoic acid export membrane protein [Streptacidiphilus sp. MAP12-16]|uniref:phosphotransferase n=1 Tax=Streptacidiphilus sp. MAP12-16 TaxID=3156300 RepID=UPI003517CDF9